MKIKSESNIYVVIEAALAECNEPVTCSDLMDFPEVHKAATKRYGSDLQNATNKLSDLLGFMWRRGILERYTAPPSRSMARYAYKMAESLNEADSSEPIPPPIRLIGKPNFSITENEGDVVIDFPGFTIRVTPK
jgi:hypothetical protein